jgi:hypothetical protein
MLIFKNILNRFIDQDKLESLLVRPRHYLGEDIIAIIPNVSMTGEGPVLKKICLITETFISEILISDPNSSAFDLTDKNLLVNIRVSTTETKVRVGQEIEIIYKTATVRLAHAVSLETTIEFVGEERDEWLASVLKLIPASLCVRRR